MRDSGYRTKKENYSFIRYHILFLADYNRRDHCLSWYLYTFYREGFMRPSQDRRVSRKTRTNFYRTCLHGGCRMDSTQRHILCKAVSREAFPKYCCAEPYHRTKNTPPFRKYTARNRRKKWTLLCYLRG